MWNKRNTSLPIRLLFFFLREKNSKNNSKSSTVIEILVDIRTCEYDLLFTSMLDERNADYFLPNEYTRIAVILYSPGDCDMRQSIRFNNR